MVTVREPEYTARDRALLLQSLADRKQPRGPHGIPIAEATDPAHQYDWEVDLPTQDFAQQQLNRYIDKYKKTYPDADLSALLWKVHRRDGTSE